MELIQACNDVNYDKVKLLIENGIDVNYIEEHLSDNALIITCRNFNNQNNIKIAKLLIKNKINMLHENKFGVNSLICATYNNNSEMIELLIKNNINISYQNVHGKNAFMIACEFGHIKMVELFIKNNIDINCCNPKNNMTGFLYACENCRHEVVDLLIKHKPDINIEQQNINGDTGIILASRYSNIKLIKILVKYGANISHQNLHGSTCFSIACLFEDEQIIQFLITYFDVDYNLNYVLNKKFNLNLDEEDNIKNDDLIISYLIKFGYLDIFDQLYNNKYILNEEHYELIWKYRYYGHFGLEYENVKKYGRLRDICF